MVIVNRFMKMIQLKTTTTNISSEEIAIIYSDKIWKLYGILRKILSDREPQFVSRFIEELMKALGSKRMLSTAYHPQTNGQMERINQEIETFLKHYVNYQQDDWAEQIVVTEFQYNNKKHVAIGQTLFVLNFEQHLWKGNLTVQTEFSKLEESLT